jgi:predicted hotdog family 3-hydroxylacyl-ACP dehydratase
MTSGAPSSAWPAIASLVPHSAPMLLLDAVLFADATAIACAATLHDNCIAAREGQVESLWAIELVAQAVGALVGYQSSLGGKPPRKGFIISCRDARFEVDHLPVQVPLTVEARLVWGDASLASFTGRVLRGVFGGAEPSGEPEVLATVELGVFSGALADRGIHSALGGRS